MLRRLPKVLLAMLLLASSGLLLTPSPAGASLFDINDFFTANGGTNRLDNPQGSIDPGVHSDAAATYWNGQYVMLYRIQVGSQPSGWPIYGLARRTSSDAVNWSAPTTPVAPTGSSPFGVQYGCGGVYAPSFVIQGGSNPSPNTITMAVEVDPKLRSNTGAAISNCEPNGEGSQQYVLLMDSTDGGQTWQNYRKVAWVNAGAGSANYGTPAIFYTAALNQVVLNYHYNPGNGGAFQTKSITISTNNPTTIGYGAGNASSNVSFSNSLGRYNKGAARRSVVYQGGYYYMVFEAFEGSILCSEATGVGLLIARSTSPGGPYTVRHAFGAPSELIYPITKSTGGSFSWCNNDMPHWFTQPTPWGTAYFVIHTRNESSIQWDALT